MSVDFPDWQQPQAIADHISLTGAPLLRLTNVLASQSGQVILATATFTPLTNVGIDQPSYEASFSAWFPSGLGATPFVRIQFQWVNFSTGVVSDTETFFMPGGNGSANAVTCYLSGPCRGSALTVNVTNLDSAQSVTFSYDVNATSHIYAHDRLFQPNYPAIAPNGFSNPDGIPTTGALVATQPSIGPNTSVFRLMACYSGRVIVAIDDSGLANGVAVRFHDPASLYTGFVQFGLQRWLVAAGSQLVQETALVNGPVLLEIRNVAATNTITPLVAVTKIDY